MNSRLVASFVLLALAVAGCGKKDVYQPREEATKQMVETLTKTLKDPVALNRLVACGGLEREYAHAKSAIPDLEQVANNDKDPKVREAAKKALEKIKGG